MVCPKCGSTNVNVQVVSNVKSRGGVHSWKKRFIFLLVYWCCMLWCVDMFLFFLGFPIHRILKHRILKYENKTETEMESYAICQDCGHKYKV